METPINHSEPAKPASAKRLQRFLHFKLQPGDEALIDYLPANQRVLLTSDGTYQEKAQNFGVPIGTVRSRIHRARAALEVLRQEHAQAPQTEAVSQPH